MHDYDVFNGDADGICALIQLRLAEPRAATLVTGVKRDIDLLRHLPASGVGRVTVLDLSMDRNQAPLRRVLAAGAEVLYVDHHFSGEVTGHPRLTCWLNEAPDICTSLLVNGHLQGRYAAWAAVGAFGDNLGKSAVAAVRTLALADSVVGRLQELGTLINYNAYGEGVEDLHLPPGDLYRQLVRYADPMDFVLGDGRYQYQLLRAGYEQDMERASALRPAHASGLSAVYFLPSKDWARRVSGSFANSIAELHPDRAHALLTEKPAGGFVVSVRAPLNRKKGAPELCRRFAAGGGREAAAGINDLPVQQVGAFIKQFRRAFE